MKSLRHLQLSSAVAAIVALAACSATQNLSPSTAAAAARLTRRNEIHRVVFRNNQRKWRLFQHQNVHL